MEILEFEFRAKMWLYNGSGPWHFLTVPKKISAEIEDMTTGLKAGFGSVKVEAQVGTTIWKTSIFPQASSSAYILPIKKEVRKAQSLELEKPFRLKLKILGIEPRH